MNVPNRTESKYYNETVRDKLTLSPLEKYVKYDRYPYKLILSLALVILTTLATFNLLNIYTRTGQAQIKVWRSVLALNDTANGENPLRSIQDFQDHLGNFILNLQNLDEILFQKIDASETKYFIEVIPLYPIADTSLNRRNRTNITRHLENNEVFEEERENSDRMLENLDNNVSLNKIRSDHQRNVSFFAENYTYEVNLDDGIVQPFNLSSTKDIKKFLQRVHKFTFHVQNIKLFTNTIYGTVDFHTCWDVEVQYSFHDQAYILAKAFTSFRPCDNVNETEPDGEDGVSRRRLSEKRAMRLNKLEYSEKIMGDSVISLHLAIFLCAAVSLVLNLKYIYEMMQVYLQTLMKSKTKRMNESINVSEESNDQDMTQIRRKTSVKEVKTLEKLLENDKPWHQLSFREKLLFFDFWYFVGILGNMVQIWASILVFAQEIGSNDYHGTYFIGILIGFSCFLAWFHLIRYLEFNRSIFTISNILKRSLPQMLFFIIGFIPIFMAYVFLGVSLFWRFDKFKNPNEATMTLFSLIMGDSIFTFITTHTGWGLISLIYFFSFLIVFFMAIQNIFVSIICSKAREKEKDPETNKKELNPTIERGTNFDSNNDFQDLISKPSRILKKKKSLDDVREPPPLTTTTGPQKFLTRTRTSMSPRNSRENQNQGDSVTNSQWGNNIEIRRVSQTPKNSQWGGVSNSQMGLSRGNTLQRRLSNKNITQAEGALYNVLGVLALKPKRMEEIGNRGAIEDREFAKDSIEARIKHESEEALWILDGMAKENSELEFYKLGFRDQVVIKKDYLDHLKRLDGKLKELIKVAKKIKKEVKRNLI